MEQLTLAEARRLAVHRAGLLKPEWLNLPTGARGRGERARQAALAVIRHFSYLQLDTVSIAGARSHALVLHSRLNGFDLELAEMLLQPGQPLFEYWGHEASWLPLALYPLFAFRRREYAVHPWWGDLIREYPKQVSDLRKRIEAEGALRSLDLEGRGSRGWWDLKLSKKIANAMWSAGELAIVERRNFQRSYELTERVIPAALRRRKVTDEEAIAALLLRALDGHGWATTGTLAKTWRLNARQQPLGQALERLREAGEIIPCALNLSDGRPQRGWIRPQHLDDLAKLKRLRPNREQGVLLSPFDPLLWDRARVQQLFQFHQLLEIFKPAAQRQYGYYCLPILAGEQLVARVDLKAHKRAGQLAVLACHFEAVSGPRQRSAQRCAVDCALTRYSGALGLTLSGWRGA